MALMKRSYKPRERHTLAAISLSKLSVMTLPFLWAASSISPDRHLPIAAAAWLRRTLHDGRSARRFLPALIAQSDSERAWLLSGWVFMAVFFLFHKFYHPEFSSGL
jgi:hypothetical protein